MAQAMPGGQGGLIRAVIQRVDRCSVAIEGRVHSETGSGLLVLLGVSARDTDEDASWLADRILNLRIFPDDRGRMNLSVADTKGEIMVVSQFTLLADCRRGRRPSFVGAASPREADQLYSQFIRALEGSGLRIASGVFGAMMTVSLDNNGPVTIIIDSPAG